MHGCNTQTIIDRIRVAMAEQVAQVGPTRRSASIVLQPSAPFRVGGGWSQEVARSSQPTGSLGKRSSGATDLSEGSSKRHPPNLNLRHLSPRKKPPRPLPSSLGCPSHPGLPLPSSAQPIHSHSPSAGEPTSPNQPRSTAKPKLPRLLAPVSGHVHAHLRKKLIDRALNNAIPEGSQVQPLANGVDEAPEADLPPLASRSQPCPPPQGDCAAVQRQGGTSRRLDPVLAAREDVLAFNRAVAHGEATSFVESATRQSKRTAGCAPPESRRADELLEDDEELLAQAEAYAKRKWPPRSVLIMSKVHLFAYALVEGVFQTRATYLRWAAIIYQATWEMELPDHPYKKPSDEIFEIMVNSIATARGKVKERLREFAARVAGFQHITKNQKIIEKNLICFNRLYPNSYHCKSIKPRSGDYESPKVGHSIALALFYGPSSVGVLYPDYFRDMPLTVVTFWQFCIKEWANAWRENSHLGMAAMRKKYEAQLAGLK
ncbi:unnamed protein product [Rhizoctonia solani]|uniref:DUF6532 domain-containing protein n=1 Tax=Rhizoctonia solani TaxID=456999 RepID=A0A8H3GL39_9AGAM|nr:unnamed protein product [Rhizoctonia solani]